ncbi:response regulator [Lutibacter sp. Hel_I_33_5]|uniref:response regulator n=1 Tax=Lutibacter sp. Hel_I_33_5 TaxID=1566289 RepID=UPI00351B11CF
MEIKILIVEDNVIIADDLQLSLEKLGYNVIGNVISYEEALATLEKNKADIVLLDISLASKKTGIELAEHINNTYKIPFIYLTSSSDLETIKKASKTKPDSYLVKPFDLNNIKASIEIAFENHINSSNKIIEENIFVKKNNLYHKIPIKEISYIKSDNVYLELYCLKHQKYILRSTLKGFISKLPNNFYKCHKSYIINLNQVSAFNYRQVIVNKVEIPVSSEFRSFLKKFIN